MKKRCKVTPENVAKWIKNGDGQGEGNNYKPFIKVRDVPSKGRSSMVRGIKTDRTHHYLSDLEYACHILAEFCLKIIDIREQFALLPSDDTQKIARRLGFKHPVYPGTKTPIVMTSDLVLTIRQGKTKKFLVLCVKHSSALRQDQEPESKRYKRTCQKLLIEKIYWKSRKVPWLIITDKTIPWTKVYNLDLLRPSLMLKHEEGLNGLLPLFVLLFYKYWEEKRILNDVLDRIAFELKKDRPYCFHLFARSVWSSILPVDLNLSKIHHFSPVPLIQQPYPELDPFNSSPSMELDHDFNK